MHINDLLRQLNENEENLSRLAPFLPANIANVFNNIDITKNENEAQKLFDFFVKNAPHLLPYLLRAKDKNGWTIGHYIAYCKSPEDINAFLNSVMNHCPNSLPALLSTTTNLGNNFLDQFFYNMNIPPKNRLSSELVYKTKDLQAWILASMTLLLLPGLLILGESFLPVLLISLIPLAIAKMNVSIYTDCFDAKFIYELVSLEPGIGTKLLRIFSCRKEDVLEHIKGLPLKEQIKALEDASTPGKALYNFFKFQRGVIPARKGHGSFAKIATQLEIAQQDESKSMTNNGQSTEQKNSKPANASEDNLQQTALKNNSRKPSLNSYAGLTLFYYGSPDTLETWDTAQCASSQATNHSY